MRFFTRSADLEAQAPNRIRSRSRTRSQSIAQPNSPQTPRPRSRTRSASTAQPRQEMSTSPLPSAPLSKASTTNTIETPIPPTPIFSKPTIPYDNPLLATEGFKTVPTSPLTSARQTASEKKKISILPEEDEKVDEKKQAFLDKYDPGEMAIPIPQISDMNLHRRMVRTFYLDNLLWATARLQRHVWVAASEAEVYKDLWTAERRDRLHEDLLRYTQAVKSFEYWKTSMMQTVDLVMPPNYDTYGRTLAMLECASHHESDPSALATIKSISNTLFKDLADFSRTQAPAHLQRAECLNAKRRKRGLLNRMAMSTFGGLTLIVPMLIMVLDPRKLVSVVTTSVFTLAVGLILAIWMDEAESKDMIAATAAYAAVLVVFVGAGTTV
ncbi:hypothetical protein BGZ57DRAFT_875647 [Hyaloscypha finlandica]|nr:hypothetical protein BGZ57DRAFT_875647 [Hyaloscypha finlandica]